MKNNLLKEIKKIKGLINILENSEDDCVTQLRDSGYKVLSPEEAKLDVTTCESDTNIKCVIDYLNNKGKKYKVGKGKSGRCYLIYQGSPEFNHYGKKWYRVNLTFWSDGTFSYIGTFEKLQTTSSGEYFQFMYEGSYTCDNTTIKFDSLSFCCLFKDGDTSKKITGVTFKPVKADGTENAKTVDNLAPNSGDISVFGL